MNSTERLRRVGRSSFVRYVRLAHNEWGVELDVLTSALACRPEIKRYHNEIFLSQTTKLVPIAC
jgi:hypothetical protein